MKKIILFLSIIALSQAAFSQKKDLFTFADLEKKFKFADSVGKKIHADSLAAFINKNFNLDRPAKTEHPKGSESFSVYEFHFKDKSSLFVLVSHPLIVTEIAHRYNYQGRTAEFTSWTAGNGKISTGKL